MAFFKKGWIVNELSFASPMVSIAFLNFDVAQKPPQTICKQMNMVMLK